MVPNEEFHIFTIHFEPPKREQPLYKGQCVPSPKVSFICTEVLLYTIPCHFNGGGVNLT